MEKEHLADVVCEKLGLECPEPDIKEWQDMVDTLKNLKDDVTVALVGESIILGTRSADIKIYVAVNQRLSGDVHKLERRID